MGASTSYDMGFRFHHSRTACWLTARSVAPRAGRPAEPAIATASPTAPMGSLVTPADTLADESAPVRVGTVPKVLPGLGSDSAVEERACPKLDVQRAPELEPGLEFPAAVPL